MEALTSFFSLLWSKMWALCSHTCSHHGMPLLPEVTLMGLLFLAWNLQNCELNKPFLLVKIAMSCWSKAELTNTMQKPEWHFFSSSLLVHCPDLRIQSGLRDLIHCLPPLCQLQSPSLYTTVSLWAQVPCIPLFSTCPPHPNPKFLPLVILSLKTFTGAFWIAIL